ncbi:MAG: signal recognition particle-docking protein FtsY [Thermodesulfovibrionales bacterium]|nr:signal recognition particle-docking protein FtsY [Thermodesulfovibrionales bacterium]
MGFFDKLKAGLAKTKKTLIDKVDEVVFGRKIDETTLEDIEEILVAADVGAKVAHDITEEIRRRIKNDTLHSSEDLREVIKREMIKTLGEPHPIKISEERPYIILTVGVNGVGKTTTIGKLASRFKKDGYSVILAAGDTFRAAAIEQIEIWAKRAGAELIKHQSGSDPAAVAFDAVEAAKHRGSDIVIIDTAGRLHTKTPLMEELKKINRVIKKSIPSAPHEILLVIDATTGQNAIRQAHIFNDAIGITGIALTKLDGTAKGGIVFAIYKEFNIPIKLIGIGEAIDDLRDFNPKDFVDALFNKD